MARKQLPWFKAWTKDILGDAQLKSVSPEARCLWIYIMCLMHTAPRRGYLMQENRHPYSNEQLGRIAGLSAETAAHLQQELITAAVFSVSEDGFPFSRRMVRESMISDVRSEAGMKGALAKHLPRQKAGNGMEYGICKPSSSNKEKESEIPNPPNGGGCRGEEGLPQQKDGKNDVCHSKASSLAADAAFVRRGAGAPPGEISLWEAHIADLLMSGIEEGAIRAEIRRKGRLRSEPPWDFQKRLMPKKAAGTNGKLSDDEFARRARGDV